MSSVKIELKKDRITSYNVCYTKLLRVGKETGGENRIIRVLWSWGDDKGRSSLPGTVWRGWTDWKFSGVSRSAPPTVITSYSIHYTKLYEIYIILKLRMIMSWFILLRDDSWSNRQWNFLSLILTRNNLFAYIVHIWLMLRLLKELSLMRKQILFSYFMMAVKCL